MQAWERVGLRGPKSVPGRNRKGLLLLPLGWGRGWGGGTSDAKQQNPHSGSGTRHLLAEPLTPEIHIKNHIGRNNLDGAVLWVCLFCFVLSFKEKISFAFLYL